MSKERLSFPEIPVRPHWLVPKLSGIARPTIWSEKGPRTRPTPKPCRPVLRPVRGGLDARIEWKSTFSHCILEMCLSLLLLYSLHSANLRNIWFYKCSDLSMRITLYYLGKNRGLVVWIHDLRPVSHGFESQKSQWWCREGPSFGWLHKQWLHSRHLEFIENDVTLRYASSVEWTLHAVLFPPQWSTCFRYLDQ